MAGMEKGRRGIKEENGVNLGYFVPVCSFLLGERNSENNSAANWAPLSVTTVLGIPKCLNIWRTEDIVEPAMEFLMAIASIHL